MGNSIAAAESESGRAARIGARGQRVSFGIQRRGQWLEGRSPLRDAPFAKARLSGQNQRFLASRALGEQVFAFGVRGQHLRDRRVFGRQFHPQQIRRGVPAIGQNQFDGAHQGLRARLKLRAQNPQHGRQRRRGALCVERRENVREEARGDDFVRICGARQKVKSSTTLWRQLGKRSRSYAQEGGGRMFAQLVDVPGSRRVEQKAHAVGGASVSGVRDRATACR